MSMQAELIVDARNAVGESPVWVPQENALYWVDIPNGGLQRWSADTRHVHAWKAPQMLACIAPHSRGGWIAGMETGFFACTRTRTAASTANCSLRSNTAAKTCASMMVVATVRAVSGRAAWC